MDSRTPEEPAAPDGVVAYSRRVQDTVASASFWTRHVVVDHDPVGPTEQSTEETGRPVLLPYLPALEGLLGIAILAVLITDGGFSVGGGGAIGVSTLFTISGFLVVSRLFAGQRLTGSTDLWAWWRHRMRRVGPVVVVGVALALAFGFIAADGGVRDRILIDAGASLTFLANWRFLLESAPDAASSPLLPMWYVAVEQQFFLVFGVAVWSLLRVLRWPRRSFAAVLVVALAISAGLMFFGGLSADHVFFATGTRMGEIAAGGLLAVALAGSRLRNLATGASTAAAPVAALGGVAALLAFILWVAVPASSTFAVNGGFLVYAVLAVGMIVGAVLTDGPVNRVLLWSPLRALGRLALGVYLYHQVVFDWIDETNSGFGSLALWLYRVVVTVAIAWASHTWFERPWRSDRRSLPARTTVVAGSHLDASAGSRTARSSRFVR